MSLASDEAELFQVGLREGEVAGVAVADENDARAWQGANLGDELLRHEAGVGLWPPTSPTPPGCGPCRWPRAGVGSRSYPIPSHPDPSR